MKVESIKPPSYGDRSGCITEPFGHVWTISNHMEDVPPEEVNRRIEAMMQQQQDAT
jgi:PhnB protein